MEAPVWMRLFAQAASYLSSLLSSLTEAQGPENPISLSNVPESAASSLLTSRTTQESASLLRMKRDPTLATEDGVFGDMICSDGWDCFTLENRALAIPAGRYGLEIYDSPHAGHPVPRLQNVPGRSEIEIHCGNVPEDSRGCILVGLVHKGDTIESSQDAFKILFPKVQKALQEGPQTIEIIDI